MKNSAAIANPATPMINPAIAKVRAVVTAKLIPKRERELLAIKVRGRAPLWEKLRGSAPLALGRSASCICRSSSRKTSWGAN